MENLALVKKIFDAKSYFYTNHTWSVECSYKRFKLNNKGIKLYAKENEADIFVSIHLNSIGNVEFNVHKHRGTSVYYFNNSAKKLAECLETDITKTAKTHEDGVKAASFAVIRPYDYVGVLIEAAYMTNPMDSVLYRQDKFIKNTAKGIVKGINRYISE